jgi:hypothetical protein
MIGKTLSQIPATNSVLGSLHTSYWKKREITYNEYLVCNAVWSADNPGEYRAAAYEPLVPLLRKYVDMRLNSIRIYDAVIAGELQEWIYRNTRIQERNNKVLESINWARDILLQHSIEEPLNRLDNTLVMFLDMHKFPREDWELVMRVRALDLIEGRRNKRAD